MNLTRVGPDPPRSQRWSRHLRPVNTYHLGDPATVMLATTVRGDAYAFAEFGHHRPGRVSA
jgi:hypothetical protein